MRHGMSSERRNRRLKRRRKRLKKRIPDLLRTGYPLLDYTGNKMGDYSTIYDFQPSFRSFDLSHLDASESIIKFLGNWSHFLHSTWEADLFTVVYNFSTGEITAAVPQSPHSAKSFTSSKYTSLSSTFNPR